MFAKIEIPSPAGALVAVARGEALCALAFADHWPKSLMHLEGRFGPVGFSAPFPKNLASRLRAYLHGELTAMDDLEVDVDGTPFQMRVWKALRTIPVGETISYRELARRASAPGAERAVGNANGKNPVGLVIPCHRVIHADGTIGGYGGGIPRKEWLLKHERPHAKVRPLRQA
jgi:methylated-DNA-[protein]-cysteine S-methyltransferase